MSTLKISWLRQRLIEDMGRSIKPHLTVIAQPVKPIGEEAAVMLVERAKLRDAVLIDER